MPSLPFLPRKKDRDPEKVNHVTADSTPPPAYTQHGKPSDAPRADDQAEFDITAAFSNLSLDANPKDPTVDTCLAHLKLLHAFQSVKEDVGYTDGLWNIWDSRAEAGGDIDLGDVECALPSGVAPPDSATSKRTPDDETKLRLSKIREKRWALFVARAVDRYEAWWATFAKVMLREKDMIEGSGSMYHDFVNLNNAMVWKETMLPPLDVLMV